VPAPSLPQARHTGRHPVAMTTTNKIIWSIDPTNKCDSARLGGAQREVMLHAIAPEHSDRQLGHDKLDTSARYTSVATGMIATIKSPDLPSPPRNKFKRTSLGPRA